MTDPRAFIIFCDDIRDEASGKPMLIGVYPADMVIQAQPPAPVSLRMYLVIDGLPPQKNGDINLELALSFLPDDGGDSVTVLKGQFNLVATGSQAASIPQRLVFRPPPVAISLPGSGLLEPHLAAPSANIPVQGMIRIRFTPTAD